MCIIEKKIEMHMHILKSSNGRKRICHDYDSTWNCVISIVVHSYTRAVCKVDHRLIEVVYHSCTSDSEHSGRKHLLQLSAQPCM